MFVDTRKSKFTDLEILHIESVVDPKHPIPCILHPTWHPPLSGVTHVTQQCDPSLCSTAGVDTVNEISSPVYRACIDNDYLELIFFHSSL